MSSTKTKIPSLLYDMLRSFSAVAKTLNVSQAVKELNFSRQTTARHISDLEEILGYSLFNITNRKYTLTQKGEDFLLHVELLLEQTRFLLEETSAHNHSLPAVREQITEDQWFFAQRHPFTKIWSLGPPLLKKSVEAWINSELYLQNESFDIVRPYLVVYRKRKKEWICVEIGEKSSYASWLGHDWAKSAIGLSFDEDPIKSQADKFMLKAHENVSRTGNIWYEHITTKYSRSQSTNPQPINYQKAIFPILFPDDSEGIAVMVVRTNNIISGAPEKLLKGEYKMPEEDVMDFPI